jgi:hypothetical protein
MQNKTRNTFKEIFIYGTLGVVLAIIVFEVVGL